LWSNDLKDKEAMGSWHFLIKMGMMIAVTGFGVLRFCKRMGFGVLGFG
jgi:hypothetical protein